jgi:rRNA maturation RNase YbeY
MVSVSISDGAPDTPCPDESRISRMASIVFEGEGRDLEDLSVVFADHDTVLALNKEWLEHDWNTDVISFLLEEDPIEGEIYVDVETAAERHVEFGVSLVNELERYVIHGMLHLCGHDDATDEQRVAMRTLEDRYLDMLNAS